MPNSSPTATVLVADEHPVTVEGIRIALSRLTFAVQTTGCRPSEVLRQATRGRWDLIILGSPCKGVDLTETLKALRASGSPAPVLIFSARDDKALAMRFLQCGARGFVTKESTLEVFAGCVQRLLRGESVIPSELRSALKSGARKESGTGIESLTDRELAVFEFIGSGTGTREIAARLGISIRTVEKHRENIKLKLGLGNAAQLATAATSWVLAK